MANVKWRIIQNGVQHYLQIGGQRHTSMCTSYDGTPTNATGWDVLGYSNGSVHTNTTGASHVVYMCIDETSTADFPDGWLQIADAASGGAQQLSELTDVGVSTATSGNLLIADGTDFDSVAMSGDVAIVASGATTIQPTAIETGMLEDDVVETAKILNNNVTLAKLEDGAADQLLTTDASGNPQYEDKSGFIETLLTPGTVGNVLSSDGTNWQSTSPSTAGIPLATEAYVDLALAGLDFQPDVLGVQIDASLDPGAAPTDGDRYVLTDSGTLNGNFGTITGVSDNDIVEYDGSDFVVVYDVNVQGEGALCWDQDTNTWQRYDGTNWSEFGGLSGITAGAGLTKTGNTIDVIAGTTYGTSMSVGTDSLELANNITGARTFNTTAGPTGNFAVTSGTNNIDLDATSGSIILTANDTSTSSELNLAAGSASLSSSGSNGVRIQATDSNNVVIEGDDSVSIASVTNAVGITGASNVNITATTGNTAIEATEGDITLTATTAGANGNININADEALMILNRFNLKCFVYV